VLVSRELREVFDQLGYWNRTAERPVSNSRRWPKLTRIPRLLSSAAKNPDAERETPPALENAGWSHSRMGLSAWNR
jgi:hypothetical protein